MIYERLLRPLLFALDPETAHHFALAFLRATGPLLPKTTGTISPVSAFGLKFRHRIGLAAGLDKNGIALPAWEALGFSFVEIGTVTAQAQPGAMSLLSQPDLARAQFFWRDHLRESRMEQE